MSAAEDRIRRITLLILVAFITAVFVAMIWRFLAVLLLAAIMSGLAAPLHRRFLALWRGRKALASASTIILLLALVGIPLAGFLAIVVSEAIQLTQRAGPWVEQALQDPEGLKHLLARLPGARFLEPHYDQILTKLSEVVQALGTLVVQKITAAGRVTFTFLLNLILFLYAMFFFLMDGRAILDKILSYLPLPYEDEMLMVGKFVSVTRATLKGTLIIGAIQGTLGGLGLEVAGVESSVFWGTVMAVGSLIPGAGTALVWLPICVILGFSGRPVAALVLTVYFVVIVSSVDNLLRPRLVGKDTEMHELFILLGTLGGLILFGPLGFILGPIVAALFVAVWDMYGTAFRKYLPAPGSTQEPGGP